MSRHKKLEMLMGMGLEGLDPDQPYRLGKPIEIEPPLEPRKAIVPSFSSAQIRRLLQGGDAPEVLLPLIIAEYEALVERSPLAGMQHVVLPRHEVQELHIARTLRDVEIAYNEQQAVTTVRRQLETLVREIFDVTLRAYVTAAQATTQESVPSHMLAAYTLEGHILGKREHLRSVDFARLVPSYGSRFHMIPPHIELETPLFCEDLGGRVEPNFRLFISPDFIGLGTSFSLVSDCGFQLSTPFSPIQSS